MAEADSKKKTNVRAEKCINPLKEQPSSVSDFKLNRQYKSSY